MTQEGRISYAIDGNKVVFYDNQLKGTLILYFKPLNPKQGSDLMYGTLNDILLSLKRKELTLELYGITRIDVQKDMIHSIAGLENAKIIRYGYAIEYDYIDPTELKHTLETKKIKNL